MGNIRIVLIFLTVSCGATIDKISVKNGPADDTFLIEVCENTLHHSNLRLFYIFNLNRDYCCSNLIQYLHNNSVTTIQSNLTDLSLYMVDEVSKMIVIIVDDFSDVTNFILSSMVGYWTPNPTNTNLLIAQPPTCGNCTGPEYSHRKSAIPNICVVYDLDSGAVLRDFRRPCDATIIATTKDLEDGSVLRDELLNFTGGAYNNVWNPENHIIFVVSPGATDAKPEMDRDLYVAFRLIWRIFKGRQTVICSPVRCFWYDTFFNETHVYAGARGEKYFDFEWRDVNQKELKVQVIDIEGYNQLLEARSGFLNWQSTVFVALEMLNDRYSANAMYHQADPTELFTMPDHKFAIKYDLVLMFIDANPRLRSANFENYDLTPTTDFGSFCFFVPRRGFKPQYLTVFKCFTPKVWVCFLLTMATFLFFQHCHKMAQLRQLARLYTEHELIQYESLSTVLTIYRYFLCTCHPRLLLVHGMVTFLNLRIRYADIETIQQLAESDLVIQSADLELDEKFLGREQEFDWIHGRLADNYKFSKEVSHQVIEYIGYSNVTPKFDDACYVCRRIPEFPEMEIGGMSVLKNLRNIMSSNAFLAFTPSNSERKNWAVMEYYQSFEFHVVPECLATFPLMYLIPKHMFATERLKYLLSRSLEIGVATKTRAEGLYFENMMQKEVKEEVVYYIR
ncbi:unnamed protein product [Bemisia tabaci]|uniref:Ionotropic receptor n=1 Tax=Bemisia tabaci TaxID=7038 RepID=A0A9P0AK27_BEMTA|nr:unnamed protein product [Bemisia tabaci]